MKILFLTRLFYPHVGGVEKHVMEVSKKLIKQGHTIIIITEGLVESPPQEIVQGITIYRIPVSENEKHKKFEIWKWLWEHRKILRSSDVIHCHDVFFWYIPFRFLFPFKPVFTTFHGYESYPIRKKAIVMRKIAEVLSRGNVCVGDFIRKWYGTKPTFVIYGATDIPKTNKKWKYDHSGVFFGRLDEQTGILTYQEAYKLLKKRFTDFRFTVIGEGKYEKDLEKSVKLEGFKQDISLYLSENRYAFVSRYLSMLEAMTAKRLIFAVYDNPVKEDYLKMAPFRKWIIIENNVEKLSEKIIYYLDNPEEEKLLLDKAYTWASKQTWDNIVTIYLQLWGKTTKN